MAIENTLMYYHSAIHRLVNLLNKSALREMLEKTSRLYTVVGEILGVISSLLQPILIKNWLKW